MKKIFVAAFVVVCVFSQYVCATKDTNKNLSDLIDNHDNGMGIVPYENFFKQLEVLNKDLIVPVFQTLKNTFIGEIKDTNSNESDNEDAWYPRTCVDDYIENAGIWIKKNISDCAKNKKY